MSGRAGNRYETYTVPEGKRAVVTFVTTVRFSATGTPHVFLWVHGAPVFHVAPGGALVTATPCRFTAYERETIKFELRGLDWGYSVDGYLLQDDDGRPDDADNVIEVIPGTRPAPLPA
jgi:hypothetical protein